MGKDHSSWYIYFNMRWCVSYVIIFYKQLSLYILIGERFLGERKTPILTISVRAIDRSLSTKKPSFSFIV